VRQFGGEVGRGFSNLDPEECRRAFGSYSELPAPAVDTAHVAFAAFSDALRDDSIEFAQAMTDPGRRTHPSLEAPIAMVLLAEPLYRPQIAVLFAAHIESAVLDDAIDAMLNSMNPMITDDPKKISDMFASPISPGVVALTASGREKLLTYLRNTTKAHSERSLRTLGRRTSVATSA
jgi:hypothetical protein